MKDKVFKWCATCPMCGAEYDRTLSYATILLSTKKSVEIGIPCKCWSCGFRFIKQVKNPFYEG